MTQVYILLLSGWSLAGKDAVAKILVETYDFQRVAFADPVKERVASEQQIPLEWCHDHVKKSQPLPNCPERTLRQELIRVGEAERRVNPGIWASLIADKIERAIEEDAYQFVISDWRNMAELFTLQKRFPHAKLLPIRVVRPSQLISPVADPTEYELVSFPFWRTIQNAGGLLRLSQEVAGLVEEDLPRLS